MPDQVTLARASLADLEILHRAADLDDLAGEFMAGDQRHGNRRPRPVVPVPDMDVGAADPGLVNADQDVFGADLRHRFALQPEAFARRGLHQRLHRVRARHIAPTCRPALENAASARSRSARVSAAFICVRIRAVPFGTTG